MRLIERGPTATDRESSAEAGLRRVQVKHIGCEAGHYARESMGFLEHTESWPTQRCPSKIVRSVILGGSREKIWLRRDAHSPASRDLVDDQVRSADEGTSVAWLGDVQDTQRRRTSHAQGPPSVAARIAHTVSLPRAMTATVRARIRKSDITDQWRA